MHTFKEDADDPTLAIVELLLAHKSKCVIADPSATCSAQSVRETGKGVVAVNALMLDAAEHAADVLDQLLVSAPRAARGPIREMAARVEQTIAGLDAEGAIVLEADESTRTAVSARL